MALPNNLRLDTGRKITFFKIKAIAAFFKHKHSCPHDVLQCNTVFTTVTFSNHAWFTKHS